MKHAATRPWTRQEFGMKTREIIEKARGNGYLCPNVG